jgi:hypothetical protein
VLWLCCLLLQHNDACLTFCVAILTGNRVHTMWLWCGQTPCSVKAYPPPAEVPTTVRYNTVAK